MNRTIATAALSALTAAVGWTGVANAQPVTATCAPPVVAAHRGGNYFAESTARNFTASAAAGAAVWETDVRFNASNYAFLLHDADLGLFGAPKLNIATATGTQIAALAAPDGSTVETVWTLAQQLLNTPGQKALVELKTMPTAAQWTLFDARMKPVVTRVWVASFATAVTRAAMARGYLTAQIDADPTVRTVSAIRALGTGYEAQWDLVTPTFAAQLKAAGVTTYAWTSDTPAVWVHDLAVGAVPLTNYPTAYLAWWRTTGCTLAGKARK